MKSNRTTTGLLAVFVLACLGVGLLYLTTLIVEQIDTISQFGDGWVYAYLSIVGVLCALMFGSSLWILWTLWSRSREKHVKQEQRDRNPSQLSAQEKSKEFEENLTSVRQLKEDAGLDPELQRQLAPLTAQLEVKRQAQTLEIVAFGTISSGKSSLLNSLAGKEIFRTDLKGGTTVRRGETPWPGLEKVSLVDTPGLGEIDGEEHVAVAAQAAKNADLVLLVVDGPLRDSEFTLLQALAQMEKRILVCLNKTDWYESRDREKLVGQIKAQLREVVQPDDIVCISAQPVKRTRMRVLADGGEVEEQVLVPPDISPLAVRMLKVVKRDGTDLLLGNLLLQSRGLVEEARARVKEALDRRAWGIVDKYMWSAGGAAAISPLPLVDLAAGCAISSKMVVDLAAVYKQKIDLETALQLLAQLGKEFIAVAGLSVGAPVVASAVGTMLKTVPGAGTIAGGLLQGVVQALVTRWIGAVFIVYFRNEMQRPEGGLAGLARRQWDKVTSLDELRKLVKQAREHFGNGGARESRNA